MHWRPIERAMIPSQHQSQRGPANGCDTRQHVSRSRAADSRFATAACRVQSRARRGDRIPNRHERCAQRHQPLCRRCATRAGRSGRNRRSALRRRYRIDRDTRGRGLPLCVGLRSGTRILGDLATAKDCPRSRQHGRAGGARRQGRAYRGYTRGPGLRGARGRGNRDTYKPWSATAARGSRDRRDWSRAGSRAAIHRAADRTGAHLRRASSNRDGERAADAPRRSPSSIAGWRRGWPSRSTN